MLAPLRVMRTGLVPLCANWGPALMPMMMMMVLGVMRVAHPIWLPSDRLLL